MVLLWFLYGIMVIKGLNWNQILVEVWMSPVLVTGGIRCEWDCCCCICFTIVVILFHCLLFWWLLKQWLGWISLDYTDQAGRKFIYVDSPVCDEKKIPYRHQGPLRGAHPLCGALSRWGLNPINNNNNNNNNNNKLAYSTGQPNG